MMTQPMRSAEHRAWEEDMSDHVVDEPAYPVDWAVRFAPLIGGREAK